MSLEQAQRLPLTTKEGFRAFAAAPSLPELPPLLAPGDHARLDATEREIDAEARKHFHSRLLLVATPDIVRISKAGFRLIVTNRGKDLGRRGLMVSGPSGTGKSTSITQLGRKHLVEVERRAPGVTDRIPVAYILAPADPEPKSLAVEFAHYFGLPVGDHDSPHSITQAVIAVMRRVRCSLVIIDEIHRLEPLTARGGKAVDQLKYFFDSVNATFVVAGMDLEELGMFSGPRGRQIAGRFITLRTSPFGHSTDAERGDWSRLVATMEQSLRLHRHRPGTLVDQAAYLHERTDGKIGSLDQLIHEAANAAIEDGSERISMRHLKTVVLDTAAEEQFAERLRHGRKTGRP